MIGDRIEALEADLDTGASRVVVQHDRLVDGVGDGSVVRRQLALRGQRRRRSSEHDRVVAHANGRLGEVDRPRVEPALQPATSTARLPTTSLVCAITLLRSSDDIA